MLPFPEDPISRAVRTFSNHPSIVKTKSFVEEGPKFEFKYIIPEDVAKQIKKLDASKSTRGNTPIKCLKDFSDTYLLPFTDIINNAINHITKHHQEQQQKIGNSFLHL